MLDSIFHMAYFVKSHFGIKMLIFCHYVVNVVMDIFT